MRLRRSERRIAKTASPNEQSRATCLGGSWYAL